jgi:carboxypeptidase PM20D1
MKKVSISDFIRYRYIIHALIIPMTLCFMVKAIGQVSLDISNSKYGNIKNVSFYSETFPEAVILLSEYLKYNSVSGNEKPAGEYLADLCRKKGLSVKIYNDQQDSYNFVASIYPLETLKPNLILLNHIDVVPAGEESEWRHPPFSGGIIENEIWGRGALDMKGMAIMQIMAISEFLTRTDLPFNISVLSVSSEENLSDLGACKIVNEHFEELNPVLVLGEGGAGIKGLSTRDPGKVFFCVSVAQKTALWLDISLRIETSGHGSVPPRKYASKEMINSLHRLLRKNPKISLNQTNRMMFRELGEQENGIKKIVLKNIGFFKPIASSTIKKEPAVYATVANTITLTEISTKEGTVNQIPQYISAKLDCRLLPGTDKQKFIDFVIKKLKSHEIQIDVLGESKSSDPTILDNYFIYLKEAIRKIHPGSVVIPILLPAFTDNNYFRQFKVPVYGLNPIFLTRDLANSVHNFDERIQIDQLMKGIEVYINFIENTITENNE